VNQMAGMKAPGAAIERDEVQGASFRRWQDARVFAFFAPMGDSNPFEESALGHDTGPAKAPRGKATRRQEKWQMRPGQPGLFAVLALSSGASEFAKVLLRGRPPGHISGYAGGEILRYRWR
jgi:hypothetical protein